MPAGSPFIHLLKQYSTSEINAGAQVRIPLEQCPTSRGGRPLHIAGITILATVNVDSVDLSMASAMPGRNFLTAIEGFRLLHAGHRHIDHVDGLELSMLEQIRFGKEESACVPADLAKADATGDATVITINIPFGRPLAEGKAKWDGVIPAAAFKRTENECTFNIPSSGLGGMQSGGTFAGVTLNQLDALQVYVTLVPLDRVQVVTPWYFGRRTTTLSDQYELDARHLGPIEFFGMRTAIQGAVDHSNISNLRIIVDGETQAQDIDAAQLAVTNPMLRANYGPTMTIDAEEYLPIVTGPPDLNRTQMTRAAVIRTEWVDDNSQARFDFVVLASGRRSDRMNSAFLLAAGAPPSPDDATTYDMNKVELRPASKTGRDTGARVLLDGQASWQGAPYAVTREAFSRAIGAA